MKTIVTIRILVLSLVVSLPAPRLEAQQPSATQAADSVVETSISPETAVAGSTAATLTQGLPRRAPQPRTLHDFWPAFAVLAALWIAMVAFVVPMHGPLRRIADRISSADNRRGGR